jgi:hypothetical protein
MGKVKGRRSAVSENLMLSVWRCRPTASIARKGVNRRVLTLSLSFENRAYIREPKGVVDISLIIIKRLPVAVFLFGYVSNL